MGKLKNKLSYILKNNDRLLAVFSKTTSFFLNIAGKFLPINPNQLLITANSMGYNDSPRVIFEKMMTENDLNHFEVVWALNDANSLPKQYRNRVKVVKPDTIAYFKTALKSKYWLTSVNIERGLHFKKPETKFLNTWHGIPIKTVGNAVKNRNDFDWAKTDFVCYSNEEEKKTFIRDFKANESSMVPCGLPRNDELYNFDDNKVKSLKSVMNLPEDKKIILYAPTWRDSSDMGERFTLDLPIDWSNLQQQLNDEYIILLRAHPYITEVKGFEFNDFVRNYSDYDNINDLLFVSDLLISDYSSVIYDYSILERPIICFAYDYDEYKQSRGLYFDLTKEMPNGIVKDENALINTIKTLDWDKETKASKLLKAKRVTYGGQATKTCIDLLFRGEH